MSDGVGSSRRRPPQCSTTRFQYDPYARRVPGVTAADTTGTYSANVGAAGRSRETAVKSAGDSPIRSSSTSAASTTACCDAPGCAAEVTALIAAPPSPYGNGADARSAWSTTAGD